MSQEQKDSARAVIVSLILAVALAALAAVDCYVVLELFKHTIATSQPVVANSLIDFGGRICFVNRFPSGLHVCDLCGVDWIYGAHRGTDHGWCINAGS